MLKRENQNKNQDQKLAGRVVSSWRELKKREPSRLKTILKKYKLILSFKTKKIRIFLKDHFNLLIKSAAQNHLRIQECKKIQAGQVCNLQFGSFSELKRYQKKVRLFTYSFSSTAISVLIAIVAMQIFFGFGGSQGATFGWLQSGWGGAVSTVTTNNHANNQSNPEGWTGIYSKDAGVDVTGTDAKIAKTLGSTVTTTDAEFNAGTKTKMYVSSNNLYAQKPDGGSCTASAECITGWCESNVCVNTWQNAPVSAVGVASGTNTGAISAATCQTLLNAIKVQTFDANVLIAGAGSKWSSSNAWCAQPQCALPAGTAGNYLVDPQAFPEVDFSAYQAQNLCKTLGGRLPKMTELACVYVNKASYGMPAVGYYASASENAAIYNWCISFGNGQQNNCGDNKSYGHRAVRCVK